MGDFNLPKISWVDFEDFGLSPLGVTTDLEANLIDGLIDCDFQQLNSIPNQYGDTAFTLIAYSQIPVQMCRLEHQKHYC
jgi:hypothetical protein